MPAKVKFPVYMSHTTAESLDLWYTLDNSRSKTAFIENAINFYIGFLTTKEDASFLPKALESSIDGRLGTFQERISKLMFKQSVELDMLMNIIAAVTELDEEYLRKLRAYSVSNVKRTNGQLSLEETVRRRNE